MLILEPGHAGELCPRRLSSPERWMIRVVAVGLAAMLALLIVSLTSQEPRSAAGCLHVTTPAATGAQEIDRCGAAARATCASALAPGPLAATSEREISQACRQAGLRVGR